MRSVHNDQAASGKKTDVKAATRVAYRLRQWILDGELAPGQRLIEADLLKLLKASRSTLREALLQLDGEGLVELVHQRGAFVTRLTQKELSDLFGVRERLEGYAAYLAAQNVDAPGSREWLNAQRETWLHSDMLNSEHKHMVENIPFHEGIVRMSGNLRLATMLRRLQIPVYRQRYFDFFGPEDREKSAEDHLAIIDAILAADSDKAEVTMREHVRRAGEIAWKTAQTLT